jgi:hypothetical protein
MSRTATAGRQAEERALSCGDSMKPSNKRVPKTLLLVLVVIVSAWVGEFTSRDSHGARSWIVFAIMVLVLAASCIWLLVDIWKSGSNRS